MSVLKTGVEMRARVRIKICGITRPGDAVVASQYGADAIGLVFFKDSPRYVDVETAGSIISVIPPFISKVGVFVEPDEKTVRSILEEISLDVLQFQGDESPGLCRCFGKPYIKAVRMAPGVDLREYAGHYPDASALLLDTHVEGVPGGTGRVFDWSMITADPGKPVILAGGLNAGNVGEAVAMVRPYAVDVSGGVEANKGIKDKNKIEAFIRAVNNA